MATWPPLAGNDSQTRAAVTQPFAGEAPIITDSAPALAGVAYLQLCYLLPTGITPYDPEDEDHTDLQKLCVAAVTTTTGKQAPYYTAGKFNHEAMTWPAALDTFAKRKDAVMGTMIQLGHLI